MLNECLANKMIELAKSFFKFYRENIEGKPCDPEKEWDPLEPEHKWSNIRMVLRLEEKLASIGCYISDKKIEGKDILLKFNGKERETLSKVEHEMWFEEKDENGWVYHPKTELIMKRDEFMLPWDSLDQKGKERNYVYTDNLIKFLMEHSIYVYKDDESDIYTTQQTFDKYYKGDKVPIILSVVGHTDIRTEDIEYIESRLNELYNVLTYRYPNTDLILMSAMAEGADRAVVKWAIKKKIPVCPVLPIGHDEYVNTFRGLGYHGNDPITESKQEFEDILNGTIPGPEGYEVYSPLYTSRRKQNRIKCFYELSAYLVSNSHIVIGIWDGRSVGLRGGTYDTLRMAYDGVDHDLVDCMPATSAVFGNKRTGHAPLLNAGEDGLVYWIEVGRQSMDYVPPEDREKAFQEKFIIDEVSKNRKPGKSCGFFFNRNLQVYEGPSKFERHIGFLKSKLCKKSIPPLKDEFTEIESGPILGGLKQLYKSIPQAFDITFRRMDRLNSEMVKEDNRLVKFIKTKLLKKKEDKDHEKDPLYGIGETTTAIYEPIVKGGCMEDMERRFLKIYRKSEVLKKKSSFNSRGISILQVISTALFSFMILFSGSLVLSFAYSLVYVGMTGWLWWHKRTKKHTRYVQYRALSESLRVQYYWSILGINDTVNTNCYGYLKNGMSWTRSVLKGYCSAFVNDYSKQWSEISRKERIVFAQNYWINEKIDYLKKDGNEKIDKVRNNARIIFCFETISMILALALSALSFAFMENLDKFLFTFEGWFDPSGRILFPSADFTVTLLIKIGIILSIFTLSFFTFIKSQTFTDTPQQAQAKQLLYDLADKKLIAMECSIGISDSRNEENKINIFHEIGVLEIDQNNDWVFEFIGRDVKKLKAAANMKDSPDSASSSVSATNT